MLFKKSRINKWEVFSCKLYEVLPEADFIEDIPRHPTINFTIAHKQFKIYSLENYLRRTKFCTEYCTYLEISGIDNTEIGILKKSIRENLNCDVITKKKSIIVNISKTRKLDKLIKFIEEQKKVSFTV